MAGEMKGVAVPGSTGYVRLFSGQLVWNGSAFEEYSSSRISFYTVAMPELGSSGVFVGNFPVTITDSGTYDYFFYLQDGASPAEADRILSTGTVKWDGSAVAVDSGTIPGAMSGADWLVYVLQAFKRTDKTTEIYAATKSAISEIRRRLKLSEDEIEKTIEDNIIVLGDYRMDLPSDFGRLISDILVKDGQTSWPLDKVSKTKFDQLYFGFGNVDNDSGTPKTYCLFGGKLLIGPIPDKTTYTYTISYGMGGAYAVTADTVSVPFTDKGREEILRWGVMWRLYADLENDDQAAKYKTLWVEGLDQLDTLERGNREPVRATVYRDI